ncbi:HAD phosphoserine phosphatase-like hydrolase, family IB [Mycobacterium basiliense]|uniref:phosphoserine phosphatase n=1 Tax=Mycobacterium basiliense TaxID=2094119 RepID=A0A3S4CZ57_9MYCO|nr:haloacid dehalogenase-like hydrolase [Mycobacterium basiliense]VDM90669.1 HAD phosphoserine phosphatase-like hydrolase, family IB [Mycobacterium basiliense]
MTPLALRALAAAAMLVLAGCSAGHHPDAGAQGATCRTLAADPGWYGDNRERIDEMIGRLGTCGSSGSVADGAHLALFDWDNTMVRNDIGNATFFWMIRNSKVRQPAAGNWSNTSQYLTPPAAAALAAACGDLAAPGQPLPTGANTGCADELVSVYTNRETRSGEIAFAGFNRRRIEPADAWAAQLLAGWTDAEITEFATAARQQNLDAAENAEQTVGTTRQTGWVRYYPQMRDLVGTLQANGFDVRIISASAEPLVRVWAAEVGIPPDRIMGIRTEHDGEVLTARLAECGGEPSIPFNEGKRCRVHEQVLGVEGPAAFQQLPEQRRQVFAAGDSDGDATFTTDATALRLIINRNQIELMCRAYANTDGRWLVNPMFINPLPVSPPYPCATQGFDDPAGGQVPLRRPDGSVVPDQQDRVH